MVVWQPRIKRWSRHTDVTGSSDAKPNKEATRQWDNSIRRGQFVVHCVPRNNQYIKPQTSHNLLMWGGIRTSIPPPIK
jgi:hypothetical protein